MGREYYRIRIVYPQGGSDWMSSQGILFNEPARPRKKCCCWDKLRMNFKKRIAAMHAYDRKEGRKTMFLGNI